MIKDDIMMGAIKPLSPRPQLSHKDAPSCKYGPSCSRGGE